LTSFLAFDFRKLSIKLSLNLLDPQLTNTTKEDDEAEDDIADLESNIINKVILYLTIRIS